LKRSTDLLEAGITARSSYDTRQRRVSSRPRFRSRTLRSGSDSRRPSSASHRHGSRSRRRVSNSSQTCSDGRRSMHRSMAWWSDRSFRLEPLRLQTSSPPRC
jgi:hypothetical protein